MDMERASPGVDGQGGQEVVPEMAGHRGKRKTKREMR